VDDVAESWLRWQRTVDASLRAYAGPGMAAVMAGPG